MKESYYKWHSPTLHSDVEMLHVGHAGYPVVLFPTSMGSFTENKDFGLINAAKWFIDEGLVQIYCPSNIDKWSWYDKGIHPAEKVRNHGYYDAMVCKEIVEKIRFNTPVGKVVMAGCSFGGYHAANFAFRHPEYVSHLFSMSGSFDIKSFLDGFYNEDVYFNNPMDYLPQLNHSDLWNMDIVLGTSDWDICLDANLAMSNILKQKNVNHWLDIRKWAKHDWPIWKTMFPHYLSRIKFD